MSFTWWMLRAWRSDVWEQAPGTGGTACNWVEPRLSARARPPLLGSPLGALRAAMANLLLIEDDGALADAFAMAFEDAGHAVTTAADGKDGLARIERDRPDVVICDVQLPR